MGELKGFFKTVNEIRIELMAVLLVSLSMFFGSAVMARDITVDVGAVKMAVANGEVEAAHNLGFMYERGIGVEKNVDEAIKWYKVGAEGGVADSQWNLALMYQKVLGDQSKTLEWYAVAAEQGHLASKFNLGLAYYYGEGVDMDFDLAYTYIKEIAELGDAEAQFLLAGMYYKGQGVDEDRWEALFWMEESAHNGLSEAKEMLASVTISEN